MNRKFSAALTLFVLVLTTAACGSIGFWNDTVDCTEDFYGLTFALPPTAEIIEQRCQTAFNPDYRVVFTMGAADIDAFYAAVPVIYWLSDTSGLLNSFRREAARATTMLTGSFGNGAILVESLIDMSDPDVYTVYYQATFVD